MDKYQITFNTWNKIASLYEEKFMDLDLYNDTYDFFCKEIEIQNPKVLEIGCGPGNVTKYLLAKRPDFKIKAIDVAPNMIQLAKKNIPTVEFQEMDCRAIHTFTEKFDAIICGFCLPYLSKEDAVKLIADAHDLLEPSGVFYLSTISGNYDKSGYETGGTGDGTYVYYYQENFLEQKLESAGFKILKLMRKEYPRKEEIEEHLIFVVRKK